MLPFAPITRLVDWFTTDAIWRDLKKFRPSEIGYTAVTIARRDIGASEFGGNNAGPDVERFRDGHGGDGAWCAAATYWWLNEAAKALGHPMPFKRTHGARKLFKRAVASGWLVKKQHLQPGDLVLWSRGRKAWQGHIGIVSKVEWTNDGKVKRWWAVCGNEGRYPAPVQETEKTKSKRLVGFARVG